MAQLVDLAQTLQMTINLRDEQMQDASEEIVDRGVRIGQLEGQVETLEVIDGERKAMIEFLEDQIHDLNLDLDDAQGQFHLQHHQ